ncbi:MAG: SufS family cysteine desulfurase [Oscillospiraceae bacterium]|nr:SufS family cysteine desulfurase [Oscillospiraceae bacterium]
MTDFELIRKEFPLIDKGDFAYLDTSATAQKPYAVLEAVRRYYEEENANPLRGLYDLSVKATEVYEGAREKTARFIGGETEEIIFTRNASESLNLVAYTYGEKVLSEGDEIIIAISEHHSNMLPWRYIAGKKGAAVKYLECDENGVYSPDSLRALLTERTRIVAMAQVSNILGRVNDIPALAALAHSAGAVFVCDGAQSVPHMKVDVKELGVDFLAFSGHKMGAPMGIGVLWGRKELLEEMPPFMYGGEMIEYVTADRVKYAEIPHKFEAGTVNAGGAAGLAAAIDFNEGIGFENIHKRETELCALAMEGIRSIPHVHIIGSEDPEEHCGIITFYVDGVHPHDISAVLADDGVYIRAGHHCAQPFHKFMGVMSTARASIGIYNSEKDIERFINSLSQLRRRMGLE